MTVLVDTSVWSLALRRRDGQNEAAPYLQSLLTLIQAQQAQLIGPIRLHQPNWA